MNDLKERAKRLSTWVKVGIVGVAALVVSPVIFLVVKGFIGLMIAGVVGLAMIMFAPVVSMIFANWKLKLVKGEASRNPIETMQNVYQERFQALGRFGDQIEKFNAKILMFRSKLAEFEKRYPAKADVFRQQLEKMVKLKEARQTQYVAAAQQLNLFRDKIEEADAIWQMAQSAKDLNLASGLEGDVLAEIKTKTAIDSVELSMNESFAQLDRLMLERQDDSVLQLALPAQKVPV